MPLSKKLDLAQTRRTLWGLVKPEAGFIKVVWIYGLVISLLTLAVPIAVQTLINTVANIASVQAIVSLAVLLLVTLLLSGVFSALRTRLMEIYERHIYARVTAQLSLRTVLAEHQFFEGRRNVEITQRYFEIMTFQKNVPALAVDGFAVVLQLLVGFVLVSFYHPMLMAFNAILLLLIYAVWRIWGRGAKRTAVALSHAKYETAKWLMHLSSAHEFFKSRRHLDYACMRTDEVTSDYVHKHEHHFKYTFAQTIAYLLLYAGASAVLLGIGGWLVVVGELSIGQLVAAELIMFTIFFSFTQFSRYLKMYYELYGAAEKLGFALSIPQERIHESEHKRPDNHELQFYQVTLSRLHQRLLLDFTLPHNTNVFAVCEHSWVQREFIHLLKQHAQLEQGWIRLGGQDLADYDLHELRQAIVTIDRALIVECTIEEYLRLSSPDATLAAMQDALTAVGLRDVIEALPEGLKTPMTALGSPLVPYELLLLKLASALLAKPALVIMNQHMDTVPAPLREQVLKMLADQPFSVIYFTNTPQQAGFNLCLHLDDTPETFSDVVPGGSNG